MLGVEKQVNADNLQRQSSKSSHVKVMSNASRVQYRVEAGEASNERSFASQIETRASLVLLRHYRRV